MKKIRNFFQVGERNSIGFKSPFFESLSRPSPKEVSYRRPLRKRTYYYKATRDSRRLLSKLRASIPDLLDCSNRQLRYMSYVLFDISGILIDRSSQWFMAMLSYNLNTAFYLKGSPACSRLSSTTRRFAFEGSTYRPIGTLYGIVPLTP